jgi:hypothetical protein
VSAVPAALRAELSAAESQLDAERKAHASTKAAATARERDLEEQLGSSRCGDPAMRGLMELQQQLQGVACEHGRYAQFFQVLVA